MFIDAHAHAFKNHPPIGGRKVFSNPQELIKRFDEVGIDKGRYFQSSVLKPFLLK